MKPRKDCIQLCWQGFIGPGSVFLYKPNFFVISGGPGSGKTTLLHELGRLGFLCAPEVARQIIQEQVRHGGEGLPWRDREIYTRLMLERSIDSYLQHASSQAPVFFDRGIPDTLCYARLIGLADESSIKDACRCYRYAPVVFLGPPWKEIYEIDAERKQDFAEAERTFEEMTEVYKECGYEITELPKRPAKERATFVLQQLHRRV